MCKLIYLPTSDAAGDPGKCFHRIITRDLKATGIISVVASASVPIALAQIPGIKIPTIYFAPQTISL